MNNTVHLMIYTDGEYFETARFGPFSSEDDAQDFADDQNHTLQLSGIPGDVASYSVISCNGLAYMPAPYLYK